MDIKQEKDIDVENVSLVANIRENVEKKAKQYFSPDTLLKEEPEDLNTFPIIQIQNGSVADIEQETDIKPIALLDSTNGVFIQEDQYPNIRIKSERSAAILNTRKNICNICDVKFANRADLQYHLADKHPFKCEICLVKLKSKQSLKRHLEGHSDKYGFECDICNRKFKRKENYKDHLVTHTNRYDFKCNICNLKLRYRSCLRKHMITHLATRLFECHTCQAKFKRKDVIKRHLKKKYKCKICACEFACRGGLKYHKASHKKNEGRFNCVICHVTLKYKQTLDQHLERHLYVYDFECSVCDKKFRLEESLKKHLVKHSTTGTLECHICRAPFARKDTLKIHLKRHSIKPNGNRKHKKELVIVLYDCLKK